MKTSKTRAAFLLLLAMLTFSTAWATDVNYHDPTASAGQQMKTVDATALTNQTELSSGWYYVSGNVSYYDRITVNGTVNLILTDGCNFEANHGIRVPRLKTLNIYAQSSAGKRGSLTAYTSWSHDEHNAAIGGDGGDDNDGSGGEAEDAGFITIYGGNITTYGNIGGGNGGNGFAYDEEVSDEWGSYSISHYGVGGHGGSVDGITIYGGNVNVEGNIGGGNAGSSEDSSSGEQAQIGCNGSANVYLSWTNRHDRITADQYVGTVTLLKSFLDTDNNSVSASSVGGKTIKPDGDFLVVTVGPLTDGMSVEVQLEADVNGEMFAAQGQEVSFRYSLPDGYTPRYCVYKTGEGINYLPVTVNQDGSCSFTMPHGDATIDFSTATVGPNDVKYYDPTVNIGQQRRVAFHPTQITNLTTSLNSGWYYVSGDVTIPNRINVNGTVNIILTDTCHFTASKGIHVASGNTLNIYAQSTGNNRGSLTANHSNAHDGHDAAIGSNGGDDGWDGTDGSDGEEAGNISIYGGNITTNGNIGGGDGGKGWAYEQGFVHNNIQYISYYAGTGGNGGNCGDINIYSGNVHVNGSIGSGSGGEGQDAFDEPYSGENGSDGSGTAHLYWSNASDRISATRYNGTVYLSKYFRNGEGNQVVGLADASIYGDTIKPDEDPHIVSLGSVPEGVTIDLDLEADESGDKHAVQNQFVNVDYSEVPEGFHLSFSTDPEMWWVDQSIFDNGDNSIAVYMRNSPLTINASLSFTLQGRTLYKDGDWNTLCLPFDLTLAGSPLADATVMELNPTTSGFADGTLTLNFTTASSIVAGKPYLVKWATPENENLVNPTFYDLGLKNANPEDEKVTTTDGYVSFVGTYESQSFSVEDKSILLVGNSNELHYPQSGAGIGAFRAYFQLNNGLLAGEPAGQGAAPLNIRLNFGEETATDLESVEQTDTVEKFWHEGHIYIRKNGVVYDAMGKMVKRVNK